MPVTATKTERLEARVPASLKKVIQRAADLKGLTLTDYVIDSLGRSAQETLLEQEQMRLQTEESIRVAKLLMNPPKPNQALKQAFKKHRTTVRMS